MSPGCEESDFGLLNHVDRLSDLPDFIMHRIIAFMDNKTAHRTSVLSKRWTCIVATNPVLELSRRCYSTENTKLRRTRFFTETTTSFWERIESTIQQYSKQNLRIRRLILRFLTVDVDFACTIDELLGIAVSSRVTELFLNGPEEYKLPDILFSAKSLIHLQCSNINLPYYKTINLVSLASLSLEDVTVEDRMINHVIGSCLSLTLLRIFHCSGFEFIVIPRYSKLETLSLDDTFIGNRISLLTLSLNGKVIVETPSLITFYLRNPRQKCWPIVSKASLLRNLKILHLFLSVITDEDLAELLSELTLLETLVLRSCHELKNITISSTRLKNFHLVDCWKLMGVVIDAPILKKFLFAGEQLPPLSAAVDNQASFDICFHTTPDNLDSIGFFELKKFLTELTRSNVTLKILLLNETSELFRKIRGKSSDVIEFDEELFDEDEELENARLGPPCKIRMLGLNVSSWRLSIPSISAFLRGLFWSCHPEILSLRVDLGTSNETIKPLMRKLEDMAKCWRHPLKRVEARNCSSLFKPCILDLDFRLYW